MSAADAKNFSITNRAKRRPPRLHYDEIKKKVIGANVEVSLVFIGPALSRSLNKKFRRKNYPTNVLAFRLSPSAGEIFINLARVSAECWKFERNAREHVAALFIHGLLHLKGFAHGSKMEKSEIRNFNYFFTDGQNNYHWSRCRHELGASRRLRKKRR